MFTEMESPWAGDGRGLVTQRIYTKDGLLVATCVQEVSKSIRNKRWFARHGSNMNTGLGSTQTRRLSQVITAVYSTNGVGRLDERHDPALAFWRCAIEFEFFWYCTLFIVSCTLVRYQRNCLIQF